jgi:trehalose 6-phosphate synthase
MPLAERIERWRALFENVRGEDVGAWRDAFVGALAGEDPVHEASALAS